VTSVIEQAKMGEIRARYPGPSFVEPVRLMHLIAAYNATPNTSEDRELDVLYPIDDALGRRQRTRVKPTFRRQARDL
jgi:hypothetical protein